MNRIVFCLGLVFVSFVVMPAHSQSFLEKMAEKAAKKAEAAAQKKAEEEAEKKMDEAFEKTEKSMESETKEEPPQSDSFDLNEIMGKMGVSSEPAIFEDSYSFQSSITMNMKSYTKDGVLKSDGIIKIYTNSGNKTFAYEFVSGEVEGNKQDQNGLFIMDVKNESSIILSDEEGKKTGVVYGGKGMMDESLWLDESDGMEGDESMEAFNPNLKKTGRTKKILGYECEEYEYEDEESFANTWITKEVDWNSKDFMTTMFRSSMYSNGIWGGFLMESKSINKVDGEKNTYSVVDINKANASTFSISDYEITNIGSMKMPQGMEEE